MAAVEMIKEWTNRWSEPGHMWGEGCYSLKRFELKATTAQKKAGPRSARRNDRRLKQKPAWDSWRSTRTTSRSLPARIRQPHCPSAGHRPTDIAGVAKSTNLQLVGRSALSELLSQRNREVLCPGRWSRGGSTKGGLEESDAPHRLKCGKRARVVRDTALLWCATDTARMDQCCHNAIDTLAHLPARPE